MREHLDQPTFTSVQEYESRFTDITLWRPYVEEVCRRHALSCQTMRGGLAGTFPVCIVDQQHVVKLFGEFFDGPRTFAVEVEASGLIETVPQVPIPELLAQGTLFVPDEPWSWPYTVTRFMPGAPLVELDSHVTFDVRKAIAVELGSMLHVSSG